MLSPIPTKVYRGVSMNVTEKLGSLIQVLQKSYKLFYQVARRANNKSAQALIYTLANQANQHYREISSQIQLLENNPVIGTGHFKWNVIPMFSEKKYDNTEELLNDCSAIENAIVKGYCSLINDSLVKLEVRALLQQHFNGFLSAFVKLKMLKSFTV